MRTAEQLEWLVVRVSLRGLEPHQHPETAGTERMKLPSAARATQGFRLSLRSMHRYRGSRAR